MKVNNVRIAAARFLIKYGATYIILVLCFLAQIQRTRLISSSPRVFYEHSRTVPVVVSQWIGEDDQPVETNLLGIATV